MRLKIRNTHRYVPNVFIRVTTDSKNIVCSDLVMESSERTVDADMTLYNWKIDPFQADNFLKLELVVMDSNREKQVIVDSRHYDEVEKVLPDSISADKVSYFPVKELKGKKVAVFSMEAQLLLERHKDKGLFGAMGGGLGILIGAFLRAARYSGVTTYFPLLAYEVGVEQKMVNKVPQFINDALLDYSIVFEGYEDVIEAWDKVDEKTVDIRLANSTHTVKVVLMRLRIKDTDTDVFIPFITLGQRIAKRLYPSEATSIERFVQAAFYSRAALAALEAFNVECDIFQVHESFPAISLVLDLFENINFNHKAIFQKAKKHIIGFAHTVVPQAFPFYDPSLIELILELDARAYDKYLCTRNFSDGSSRRVFDPFYALSIVAVGVGNSGKRAFKGNAPGLSRLCP